MVKSINDRPILDRNGDLLSRSVFAKRLCRALIDPEHGISTGVVVGLTGPWGSGKSSLLNMTFGELADSYPNAVLVRFDPWLVSGRDQLVRSFLIEIEGAIAKKFFKKRLGRKARSSLAKYAETIGEMSTALLPFGEAIGKTVKAVGKSMGDEKSIDALRKNVEAGLLELRVPIVVLIDELDRLESSDARTMAQLVKAVVDFPSVSYLLAYDADRLSEALGSNEDILKRQQEGSRYLEKIVQHQIPIPLILRDEIGDLFDSAVRGVSEPITKQEITATPRYQILRDIALDGLVSTPRDIKRISGTFRVIAPMVAGEVDPVDVLGYSILSAKTPKLIEHLRQRSETFVFDPIDRRVINERAIASMGQTPYRKPYVELVGETEFPVAIGTLIEFLFPAVADKGTDQSSSAFFNNDRIAYRRPLLTLLRLGLLPGALSRNVIEDFFKGDSGSRVAHLRKLSESLDFPTAFDRITDIYLQRENIDELDFWNVIANFLKKQDRDWPSDVAIASDFSRAFSNLFFDALGRKETFKARSLEVFESLIDKGDLEIAPLLLRKHVISYGLFGWKAGNFENDGLFLTVEKTEKLTISLSNTWRELHKLGELLTASWGLNTVFAMIDCNIWDSECRDLVTSTLLDYRAIDGLSLLMFGGQVSTNRSTVDKIVDREKFLQGIENRKRDGSLPTPSLAARRAMEKATSNNY